MSDKPTKEEIIKWIDSWDLPHLEYASPNDYSVLISIRSLIERVDVVERLAEVARNSIVWIENYPARQAVKTALAAFEEKREAKEKRAYMTNS